MQPRVFNDFKLTAPLNNQLNGFRLHVHSAGRFRWHSHGAVRCSFNNRDSYGDVRCCFQILEIRRRGSVLHILRCGSLRISEIVNATARFGAVYRCREPYGAVRLYLMSYGTGRCGFQIVKCTVRCCSVLKRAEIRRLGSVHLTAPNRTKPIRKTAP